MAITDWPEGERPPKKRLALGAGALSDAELLAIFLRTGVTGKSAVDVARELISAFGSLGVLLGAARASFTAHHGLGNAKYAQLQEVVEMAKRALKEDMRAGDVMISPGAVRDYLRLALGQRPYEVFMAIFLDAQNRLLAADELFRGTLTQTTVYPREVVKAALAHNAAAVVFAHNHPSGIAEPSHADEILTRSLKQALALVEVKALDHFVVGGLQAMSFAERGLL